MTRYPNAYSTPSHRNHIKAVEDNLNSAKLAQREVQNQQESECCTSIPSNMCILFVHCLTEVFDNRACPCDEVEMKKRV